MMRQAKALDRSSKLGRAILLASLAVGFGAQAQTLPDQRRSIVKQNAKEAEAARCARHGEGFVPVVGSDGCVKIGGRLRIDLGASGRAPVYAGTGDGIGPAAHIRLQNR